MKDPAEEKIGQLLEAYETMRQSFITIKRLMPEVEAELLSKMGGVGAAPERKTTRGSLEMQSRIRADFYRRQKVKK